MKRIKVDRTLSIEVFTSGSFFLVYHSKDGEEFVYVPKYLIGDLVAAYLEALNKGE